MQRGEGEGFLIKGKGKMRPLGKKGKGNEKRKKGRIEEYEGTEKLTRCRKEKGKFERERESGKRKPVKKKEKKGKRGKELVYFPLLFFSFFIFLIYECI